MKEISIIVEEWKKTSADPIITNNCVLFVPVAANNFIVGSAITSASHNQWLVTQFLQLIG